MPTWRKATWTLAIWNLLIFAWVVTGIAANITVTGQAVVWLIGSALLVLVWLMSRSRFTTQVFGPQGQQSTVTAKDAKRRVEYRGWSYTARVTQTGSPRTAA
jgi:Na+-transporting methylmalonyl-CoA/oxaloacetate decarboxylase gamma subunit